MAYPVFWYVPFTHYTVQIFRHYWIAHRKCVIKLCGIYEHGQHPLPSCSSLRLSSFTSNVLFLNIIWFLISLPHSRFYHNSAKWERALEETADDVELENELVKLTKLRDLRWVSSVKRAVEALLADWPAVVAHRWKEADEKLYAEQGRRAIWRLSQAGGLSACYTSWQTFFSPR